MKIINLSYLYFYKPFYTNVVAYSTDNTSFKKVEKKYTVNSGYTYDLSFRVNNVCGGKEKEFASYHYYFGFPEEQKTTEGDKVPFFIAFFKLPI